MITADATLVTHRGRRYLMQLCEHVTHLQQMPGGVRAEAEWSDDFGTIRQGDALCTLQVAADALHLHAEAPDGAALHDLVQRIGGRLEQIGRRDRLRVAWQTAGEGPAASPAPTAGGREARDHG